MYCSISFVTCVVLCFYLPLYFFEWVPSFASFIYMGFPSTQRKEFRPSFCQVEVLNLSNNGDGVGKDAK